MKLLAPLAVSAALFGAGAPLYAQGVDPLWKKAVEQVRGAKKSIPQDIDFEGTDRTKAKPLGRILNHSHLSGWAEGKPTYDIVQIEPKPEPGKAHEVDTIDPQSLVELANSSVKLEAAVQRSDDQSLDGKKLTLFHISKNNAMATTDIKLWVDPGSGCPHRMESRLHATLTVDLFISTEYLASAQSECLPRQSTIDLKSLVPFASQDVLIVSTFNNWRERTAQ